MRIAAIADSHFREATLDDCVVAHDEFLARIKGGRPDLILHAGDLYDRRSTPIERLAVFAWIQRAASIAPVLIVRGNHDAIGDLATLPLCDCKHPIVVCERPGAAVGSFDAPWTQHPGGMIEIGGVRVLPMPWVDTATVAAANLDATVEGVQRLTSTTAIDYLRSAAQVGKPDVVVLHGMILGAQMPSGQTMIGGGVEYVAGDLADLAPIVIAGHVHERQSWGGVHYCGSPLSHDFGDEGQHGFLWIEDGAVEFVELRKAPARVTVDVDLTETVSVDWNSLLRGFDGVRVRLRYQILASDVDKIAPDHLRAYARTLGVRELVLEAKIAHDTRPREAAAEVAAAETTWDAIRALWAARGDSVPPPAECRIRAKLAELEGGAA